MSPMEVNDRGVYDVLIDRDKCVVCLACTKHCPREALYEKWDDKISIIFDYNKCDNCRECVEHCPHKCISVEAKKSWSGPEHVLLVQDDFETCLQCGRPYASQKHLNSVSLKIDKSTQTDLKYCPSCRNIRIGELLHM